MTLDWIVIGLLVLLFAPLGWFFRDSIRGARGRKVNEVAVTDPAHALPGWTVELDGACSHDPAYLPSGWVVWAMKPMDAAPFLIAWGPRDEPSFWKSRDLPTVDDLDDWVIEIGLSRDAMPDDAPDRTRRTGALTAFMDYARTAHQIGVL